MRFSVRVIFDRLKVMCAESGGMLGADYYGRFEGGDPFFERVPLPRSPRLHTSRE